MPSRCSYRRYTMIDVYTFSYLFKKHNVSLYKENFFKQIQKFLFRTKTSEFNTFTIKLNIKKKILIYYFKSFQRPVVICFYQGEFLFVFQN